MNLIRLPSYEGDLVKYATGNNDESITATLVYSTKFEDEMEMRFVIKNQRSMVIGHKEIMDGWSYDQFQNQVMKHLDLVQLIQK